VLAILLMAAVGAGGATLDDAGVCASCHGTQAVQGATTGGHAPVLDCTSCHKDRRRGRIGPHHRTVPRCDDCHDQPTGHPAHAKPRHGRRATRDCLACHDPHGSTNLHLVNTTIQWRRRVTNVTFATEAGAAPEGFTDPDAPGTGLCELCHRKTDFYTRTGGGKPHFTDTCTDCHDHAQAFAPIASESNCAICHTDEAARHAKPSKHTDLACSTCHAEVSPTPGKGHRAAETCESCHETPATHAPAGHGALPCTQCHDPHGSGNTQLVRDTLTTTGGADVPIHFDNLLGRVDGSFASATAPGTGICEVCHTQTSFYRSDGTGDSHCAFSCLPCHGHGGGFEPPPDGLCPTSLQ
jgi:predicted CXXCH cytochrome family protein